MIQITCQKEGFWRAGVCHPKGTNEYPDDTFTDKQLELLINEPLLVVVLGVEDPPVTDDQLIKLDKLVEAISTLALDNQDLWTRAGAPQVSALEEASGLEVSSAERDQAWQAWQKKKDNG